jgi:hypothetical protein
MSPKYASEQAARLDRLAMSAERSVSCSLAGILFPLVHLLLELLGFFLVDK